MSPVYADYARSSAAVAGPRPQRCSVGNRREDDAERGLRKLPARREPCKLFLNDLKLGFDRGEMGARLMPLVCNVRMFVSDITRVMPA
jgi:hypothetical protein